MAHQRTLSVTAATGRGVAGLVKDAERGDDIIVERHGQAVAAVISMEHFDELHRVRADLIAASLVLARELSDGCALTPERCSDKCSSSPTSPWQPSEHPPEGWHGYQSWT